MSTYPNFARISYVVSFVSLLVSMEDFCALRLCSTERSSSMPSHAFLLTASTPLPN